MIINHLGKTPKEGRYEVGQAQSDVRSKELQKVRNLANSFKTCSNHQGISEYSLFMPIYHFSNN